MEEKERMRRPPRHSRAWLAGMKKRFNRRKEKERRGRITKE